MLVYVEEVAEDHVRFSVETDSGGSCMFMLSRDKIRKISIQEASPYVDYGEEGDTWTSTGPKNQKTLQIIEATGFYGIYLEDVDTLLYRSSGAAQAFACNASIAISHRCS